MKSPGLNNNLKETRGEPISPRLAKKQWNIIMIKLYDGGIFLVNGKEIVEEHNAPAHFSAEQAKQGTISWSILSAHNTSGDISRLKLKFDALTSHDITFVGIVQTAKASGMSHFPLPYVLTNCHNSLCAVGGTINSDDHMFGLSAAKKYGGIFVPPHLAVIHQYMREMMAGGGKMILGSDSHTRYGALGTLAMGEGGGELVKQLLSDTYDIAYPGVVAIHLSGKPQPGIGPHDVALAIIGAVFAKGYVKNKIMEFVGPGVTSMTTDFRNGVDVMTTETTCLSSIWRTDTDTRNFLAAHGREESWQPLDPANVAYYDGCVQVDLSAIRPMIALPFHPSNVYTIDALNENLTDILHGVDMEAKHIGGAEAPFSLLSHVENGKLRVQQGIIAGCAGGNYSNVYAAANLLRNQNCGSGEFSLAVYPSSQPVFMELVKQGAIADLMAAGAIIRTAFCGPCFGAGDTPCHNGLSVRHTTRNFPNREGSKPGVGQMSAVALMDARSIAATAANGGLLTSATGYEWDEATEYSFNETPYQHRVYYGVNKRIDDAELVYGPNIKDWPQLGALTDNILLKVVSRIMDPVTTTDELIPSGETSSYRSNPLGLAEYTLSRRDPQYVGRSKAVRALEEARVGGETAAELLPIFEKIRMLPGFADLRAQQVEVGSMIYAIKPGDGSAREQAASCQRVLGGLANVAQEYATKRYRSNVINWGMLPFQLEALPDFVIGDAIFVPGIRAALDANASGFPAFVISASGEVMEIMLTMAPLTAEEREIIKAGCLINYNKSRKN